MAATQEHKGEIQALQLKVTSIKRQLQLHQTRLNDDEERSMPLNLDIVFTFLSAIVKTRQISENK